jgi:hypothetical protein
MSAADQPGSGGFLGRWSQRKRDAQAGRPLAEPLPASEPQITARHNAEVAQPIPVEKEGSIRNEPRLAPTAERDLPTLADAQKLTPASDFQPFMSEGVASEVRNAAMKKLFTDPHFNVMDGLDIYIDDYSLPDPLPAGMLEKMVGAQLLNLVPTPAPEGGPAATALEQAQVQAQALENPDQSPQAQQPDAVVAQSPDSAGPLAAPDTEHDHTDLQLQPNPAPADPQAGTTAG